MILLPAIDLIGGRAVRLLRGDYDQMTVYDPDAVHTARIFKELGAQAIHLVDLEGARDGGLPNRETVLRIKKETGLICEIGGGIRDMDAVRAYLDSGLDRVILGTAAAQDPAFAREAARCYPGKVAVGMDLKDGLVAVRGWLEKTEWSAESFLDRMTGEGIDTFIVTNVSKDGAMQGTDTELYRSLRKAYPGCRFIASGGISSVEELIRLKDMELYGAIVGKAYYTGSVDLKQAIEVTK